MSSRFLQAFRDVDIDLILEQLDVKENETTRFCLLHRGEDVFFQLCRDRKIKLNVYMEFEREMLRLAQLLYNENGSALCLAIPTSNSENVMENPYARITMNLEDRKWLATECWKCKEITNAGDLKK